MRLKPFREKAHQVPASRVAGDDAKRLSAPVLVPIVAVLRKNYCRCVEVSAGPFDFEKQPMA
jgi:hypothetical protein